MFFVIINRNGEKCEKLIGCPRKHRFRDKRLSVECGLIIFPIGNIRLSPIGKPYISHPVANSECIYFRTVECKFMCKNRNFLFIRDIFSQDFLPCDSCKSGNKSINTFIYQCGGILCLFGKLNTNFFHHCFF